MPQVRIIAKNFMDMVASLPAMKLDALYRNQFICEAILRSSFFCSFPLCIRLKLLKFWFFLFGFRIIEIQTFMGMIEDGNLKVFWKISSGRICFEVLIYFYFVCLGPCHLWQRSMCYNCCTLMSRWQPSCCRSGWLQMGLRSTKLPLIGWFS